MFEYLMQLLVMPTYEGTLFHETYRAVVDRHIEYGRERGVRSRGFGGTLSRSRSSTLETRLTLSHSKFFP